MHTPIHTQRHTHTCTQIHMYEHTGTCTHTERHTHEPEPYGNFSLTVSQVRWVSIPSFCTHGNCEQWNLIVVNSENQPDSIWTMGLQCSRSDSKSISPGSFPWVTASSQGFPLAMSCSTMYIMFTVDVAHDLDCKV